MPQPPGTPPAGTPSPTQQGDATQAGATQGGAAQGETSKPRGAPRIATVALVVSLVLVVVLTGVLATVAVLMTRNPDAPPLSTVAVRRLETPMHLAPVTGVRQAPCPGVEAVLDEAGTTCYQVEAGVTLSTVQKIETVPERNGSYSVRIVLSPDSRDRISNLTRETVRRHLALVVGDKVVTAPRVTQAITQDSLSIAGFTKETADALVARLLGTSGGTAPATDPTADPGGDPATDPGTAPPTAPPDTGGDQGTAPTTTDPAATDPAATTPATTAPGGTAPTTDPAATQPAGTDATTGTGTSGTGTNGTGASGTRDTGGAGTATTAAAGGSPRFADCREAIANGYGPYTRGWHPEYEWYADGDIDHDGVACDPQDMAA